jgi:hypothetical protein
MKSYSLQALKSSLNDRSTRLLENWSIKFVASHLVPFAKIQNSWPIPYALYNRNKNRLSIQTVQIQTYICI